MDRLEKVENLMSISQSKQSQRNGPLQCYDIDYTGGQMEKILEITAEPITEQQIKKWQERELWQARNQNEFCHACKEGGDLLCCDSCPAAFHLQCCNPPMDEEKAPMQDAEWACHRCVVIGNGSIDNKSHKHRLTAQTINILKSSSKFQDKVNGKSLGTQYLTQRSTPTKSRSVKAAPKTEEVQKDEGPMTCFADLLGGEVFENTQLFNFDYPHLVAAPLPDTKKKRVEKRGRKANETDAVSSVARKLCFNCEKNSRMGPMIQCDFCPMAYHFDCLDPPIMQPSGKKWMCPLHPQKNLLEPSVTQSFAKRVEIQNYFTRPINPQQVKINFIKKARTEAEFHLSRPASVVVGRHPYSNVHESIKAAYRQFRPTHRSSTPPPCDDDVPGCSTSPSADPPAPPAAAVFESATATRTGDEEMEITPTTDELPPPNNGHLQATEVVAKSSDLAIATTPTTPGEDVAMMESLVIPGMVPKLEVVESTESVGDLTYINGMPNMEMEAAKEMIRKLIYGGGDSAMMQQAIKSVMADSKMKLPPVLSFNDRLEMRRKEMKEDGYPVRAILVDVTHNRRYYIYEDQLTIGRSTDCTIHLPDKANCNRIIPHHATIFYDKLTGMWELISEGSTYVDGFHYGLDFVTPFHVDSPMRAQNDPFSVLLRTVLKNENKTGSEYPIAPTPNYITNQFPVLPCKCAGKIVEAGWEGPAALAHGSVVKIGCLELVFALMDQEKKTCHQYNYREFTKKHKEAPMITDYDEYTDSCSERERASEEPKQDTRVKKKKSKKVLDAMKEKTTAAKKRIKRIKFDQPGEAPPSKVAKVNGQTKPKKSAAPGEGGNAASATKEKKPRRYKAKKAKVSAAPTTDNIAVGQIITSPPKVATTNITTGEIKEHHHHQANPKIAGSKLNKKKVFHHPMSPATHSTTKTATAASGRGGSKFNGSSPQPPPPRKFHASASCFEIYPDLSPSPKKRTGTSTGTTTSSGSQLNNFGFAALSEQQFLHHMPPASDVYDMEPKNSALCGTAESVSLSDRSSSSRMDDLIKNLEEGSV